MIDIRSKLCDLREKDIVELRNINRGRYPKKEDRIK